MVTEGVSFQKIAILCVVVFGAIIVFPMVAPFLTDDSEEFKNTSIQKDRIHYFKDQEKGLCFAVYQRNKAAYPEGLTQVDCEYLKEG